MIRNCLEWILFDVSALGLGLVTVPIFVDDRPSNIRHIIKETGSRLVLAPDRDRWLQINDSGDRLPEVDRVVTLKSDSQKLGDAGSGNVISALETWLPQTETDCTAKDQDPNTLATIVYTSGTTGMPKGVMLSHANMLENCFACLRRITVYREDIFLSFLPLSHTFERTVGHYIPMMAGSCIAYARSIDKLSEDFIKVHPTVLISVPRIYERTYAKIEAGLKEKNLVSRILFRLTVQIGWHRFLHLQKHRSWTPILLLWPLRERIVANRILKSFGNRLRMSISGGAPIGLSIARVFIGLGLNFLQGYGLTETSPVVAVNAAEDNDPSTVGPPLPGVEVTFAENGELLVRGPNVMLGYWKNREATESVIDSEGYFHTGDVAEQGAAGHLKIVGRTKEIIVLSNGEKIPPGDLELAITESPLFEQAMVLGEGRPYLAALVVLDKVEWEKLASEKGLRPDAPADQRGEQVLLKKIARTIHRFPGYAQIRRIHATLDPWSMQDGLVTTSLKLRRKEILKRFEKEVESLFQGH
ncbi:MAG: long-chain fatty acid--CoA ligase [Acidobacteriota bacterium]